MLLIFKVIGLAPYGTRKFPTSIRLKKGTKQISPPVQFSTSNLGCFYNLILLFAQIYMLTLSIPLLEEMDYPEQSDLTVIIEEVESVFGNLFLFCIWLIIGFRQKTAVKLINRLLSVDNRTVSCNSNYFTDSSGNFFAISFAVNIAVSVGLVVTEMIAYNIFVLTLFAVMLTSFILAWFTIQYVFVIKLIENRFKGLNRALRDHLALSCSSDFRLAQLFSVRAATIKYSRELRIFTIRKAHMNLCEISDEIAEFYSFPILLTIAYASFTIIYNAYYLVIACILSDDNLNEFVIINAILWLASHMIPLAMLAATVDNISREVCCQNVNNLIFIILKDLF